MTAATPVSPTAPPPAPPASPPYVNRWNLPGSLLPFVCTGATSACFALDGDLDALRSLCGRYLNAPSGGRLNYQPISHHVLLCVNQIARMTSQNPTWSDLGWSPEVEAAFWVFTAAIVDRDGVPTADHLASFCPYLFVDNPLALVQGREMYGMPKEQGWFTFTPGATNWETINLDCFGQQEFSQDAQTQRTPLLAIARTNQGGGTLSRLEVLWTGVEDALSGITKVLFADREIALPGVAFAESLLDDYLHHRETSVFLKQFWDGANAGLAYYQAVLEAPVTVTAHRNVQSLPGDYQVALQSLASHPIMSDLGIQSEQTPALSYALDFDFILGPATPVG